MKTSIFINLLSILILVGYQLPAQTEIVKTTTNPDHSVWTAENSSNYTKSTLLQTDSAHWTKLPELPANFEARMNAIAFSIGNKAYVGGGVGSKGGRRSVLKDFWEFDATTGVWTALPALPSDFEGRQRILLSFGIGNKAYVGGFNSFWEFNSTTGAWKELPALPINSEGITDLIPFSLGKKVYVVDMGSIKEADSVTKFWEFNSTTSKWTQLPNLPTDFKARKGAFSFTIGDKAYVGGGSADKDIFLKDLWEFDGTTGKWKVLAALPTDFEARIGTFSFSIGDKAYIGGGVGKDEDIMFDDFWEFDSTTDKWTQLGVLPAELKDRFYPVIWTVNNEAYIGAGIEIDSGMPLKDFWGFNAKEKFKIAPYAAKKLLSPLDSSNWEVLSTDPYHLGFISGAVAFSISNKAYIGTGRIGKDSGKEFMVFNSTTGEWVELPALPTDFEGRANAIAFSIGDKAYIGTGVNSKTGVLKDFWEFDASTGIWTALPPLPDDFEARALAVAFTIGNKAYVGTGMVTGANSAISSSKDFWEFDATTGVWSKLAALPADFEARAGAVAFSIGNKAYVGTGGSVKTDARKDFWEFDATTSIWTELPALPTDFEARFLAVAFTVGSKAYVGTGADSDYVSLNDFWEFDSTSGIWTASTALPSDFDARASAVVFSIDNKVYIGTGRSSRRSLMNPKDFWELTCRQK